MFGTLADFKDLLRESHKRNIKVIIDQVYNHTSDKHPWFIESMSSKDNPKSDWYIWVDGEKGKPPNNWLSYFGGSAWEWSEVRKQYYLHLFVKEQPDLNWRNPHVVDAVMDSIKYWLDMGVDGFRFDVVNMFYKDDRLRDDPKVEGRLSKVDYENYYRVFENDRPETLLAVEKINDLVNQYQDRVTIGEVGSPMGLPAYFLYTMPGRLDLAFNFEFKEINSYSPIKYKKLILDTEKLYQSIAWPSYVLGNHDSKRFTERFKDLQDKKEKIQVLASMLLTMKGTAFIYYGEEIGMEDAEIPFEKIVDPAGRNLWPDYKGRDSARTPMQWDDGVFSTFSKVEPWLPVTDDYKVLNVKAQMSDQDSLLHFYKRLITLRKTSDAIKYGTIQFVDIDPNVLAYTRSFQNERIFVILNFSEKNIKLSGSLVNEFKKILLTNIEIQTVDSVIKPNEVRILK
ncbi:MAG: alpha-glucosidase, partial [Thermotogaceae bacterium]|nr:alpha-glucosidase [Thermotogaceae bacterium]